MAKGMTYYKLTDNNNQTYNKTQWGEGVTIEAVEAGSELCSNQVIHVYDHPLKAVMFNPIHADFKEYNLWECEVEGIVANDGLKIGVKKCTTIRQIKSPEITTNQRVRFAIYCALEVYHEPQFVEWANSWLSGKDRSEAAAWAAWSAAGAAAWSAAGAAAWSAAEAAARAAGAAAWSAAAWSAAAGSAGSASGSPMHKIDFIAIIRKAIKEEVK